MTDRPASTDYRVPRATESELQRWRSAALALCDEADLISMAGFRRDLRIDTKPDRSFVTDVDRAIERMIRQHLRAAYPECGIVGEEEGTEDAGDRLCWYIDPIDATHNYMRGVPVFATMLAAAVDGEVQVGVVSAPALRERWVAWRDGGAWRGSERISVSKVATIEESQVIYGSRRADVRSGLMPGFDAVMDVAWRTRGFGDFWGYMLVAEGAGEAMVETGAHPWDWAAPQIIVEEAGGRFTTAAGERRIDGASAVASNGLIHDELLRRLRKRQG
ncbi:MAG TPA: inositol monophosphatase family protein [Candidatus Limnocylindrales bacterium]